MRGHILLRLQSIPSKRHPDLASAPEHSQHDTITTKGPFQKHRNTESQKKSPQLRLQPLRSANPTRRDPPHLPATKTEPPLETIHHRSHSPHLVLILGQLHRPRLHARLEMPPHTQKIQKQLAKIHQQNPHPHLTLQIRPHPASGVPLLPGFIHQNPSTTLTNGHLHLRPHHPAGIEPNLRAHQHPRMQTLHATKQLFAASNRPNAIRCRHFHEIVLYTRIPRDRKCRISHRIARFRACFVAVACVDEYSRVAATLESLPLE